METDKSVSGCSMLERWRNSDFHFSRPAGDIKKDGAEIRRNNRKRGNMFTPAELANMFR